MSVKNGWRAVCEWPVKQRWHTNNYFLAVAQMFFLSGSFSLHILFLTYHTRLDPAYVCCCFFFLPFSYLSLRSELPVSSLSSPPLSVASEPLPRSPAMRRACGESRQSPGPRTPPDKVAEVCHSEIKTAPSIQRDPPPGSHYHSRSPCQKTLKWICSARAVTFQQTAVISRSLCLVR